ncbi:MAG: hypothetical protein V1809_03940 [Planctomycetota bacterium]
MAKLNRRDLESRLQYDWKVASRIESPLLKIRAFKTAEEAQGEIRGTAISSPAQASSARHYAVEYAVRSMIEKEVFHNHFRAHFDLLAGSNFPFTPPTVTITSTPRPWSPHFSLSGWVCIGNNWDPNGNYLVAQLMLDVIRFLNWDEHDSGDRYVGFNASAYRYWLNKRHGQPITPGLSYPKLPLDLTHGIDETPKNNYFKPLGGDFIIPSDKGFFTPV